MALAPRALARPCVAFLALLATALPDTAAYAQGRGAPKAPPAPPAAPSPAANLPAPPSVNDPMLAPMPPAKRNVSTWEEVLTFVRARSTDLQIALADVTRAEGQSRSALAGALPSLTAQGTVAKDIITHEIPVGPGTVSQQPNPDVYVNGSLGLTQPVLALRAWHSIETARMNESVAKLGVSEVKRTITLRVANAVIGVVTAERVAELNRVGLRTSLERLDLSVRKKALGAATGLDVLRSQQDVEQARATLITGDESLRQAREALGLALGVPEPVGVVADVNLDGIQRSAANSCKAAGSIDERSDLAAARARQEVAERGTRDVRYQYFPTINAQSNLRANSRSPQTSPTWEILGVLNFPLWEGGARYGAMKTAEADIVRSESTLTSLRRSANVEVGQAMRGVGVAEQSRKVASDSRALAAEAERLARAGFLEGQGTSLELVLAAQALRQAEVTLALKEFELVRARLAALLAASNCSL
ncbi:MAG: TolC family protein [Myxococcales bacterium]|nr:TolC family protein [Myxococcales bacterium]